MQMKKRPLRVMWCVAPLLLPLAAQAQVAPPSAGSILRQAAPPAPLPPAPPGREITLTPPGQQALPATISVRVRQVLISGNRLVPTATLQALLRPVIGQEVPLSRLDEAVSKITALYQSEGYPLAYAYLPPQKIADGVVRVEVVEPRYDRIVVSGKTRLRESVIKSTMGVRPGEPVAQAPLDRGLMLLNQTPGVRVAGELVPGVDPGTSSLRLNAQDEPLISGAVSENNYGMKDTGTFLTNGAVRIDDPFGYGSSLGVNGTVSDDGRFRSGGFQMTSPGWRGMRAGLYGSATSYRLGGSFAPLGETGRANQLGVNVNVPLLLSPKYTLALRADAFGNWISQSTQSTGSTAQQTIPIVRLSLAGALADRFGGITQANVWIEHGNLSIGPASAQANDASGPAASGGFNVAQLQVQRQQALPRGFTLTLAASGQISGRNLDSSQKFYLGGPYGVMGYPSGDGGGDEGYLLMGKLSHAVPLPDLPGTLSASLLAQTGTVRVNHTPYAGFTGQNIISQRALGIGLDYTWQRLTVSAVYEHQIGAEDSQLTSTGRNQAWLNLSYAF